MRILLVEDDDRIARPLAEDLRHQNHVVDVAGDGLTAWEYAESTPYDLILLDWMLPKLDGIGLCKRLRSHGFQALILMLTAKDTTTDKVVGLDAGADDYLVKPFELEELAARIRALSRRRPETQPIVLTYGELQMDLLTRIVSYESNPISLTPKEYMLLECFLERPTQVFPRAVLLEKLWELDQSVGENTIKTHITNLRQKLKNGGCNGDMIETVYGVGYRLISIPNL